MNPLFPANYRKLFFWLLVSSILFLSACQNITPYQAYEGAAKTDSEVAIFNVPSPYNLLSIDGVKFKQLALRDGAMVKLLPGSHQFIIEYQDFWNLDGGEHEKVTSKPMAITFTAQAGSQYIIKATQFETLEKSHNFAENPNISIIDTTNKQTVPTEAKYNLYGKGLFATLFGKSESELVQPSGNTINTAPNTKNPNKDGKALEMLKYWWETADEKQQGSFRQWLNNQ